MNKRHSPTQIVSWLVDENHTRCLQKDKCNSQSWNYFPHIWASPFLCQCFLVEVIFRQHKKKCLESSFKISNILSISTQDIMNLNIEHVHLCYLFSKPKYLIVFWHSNGCQKIIHHIRVWFYCICGHLGIFLVVYFPVWLLWLVLVRDWRNVVSGVSYATVVLSTKLHGAI